MIQLIGSIKTLEKKKTKTKKDETIEEASPHERSASQSREEKRWERQR